MELDPQEQIWARNWFYGAGTAAILLAFFMVTADYKLSNSDREIRVAETLRELRTAQFGLGSQNIDHRLLADEIGSEVSSTRVETELHAGAHAGETAAQPSRVQPVQSEEETGSARPEREEAAPDAEPETPAAH